MRIDIESIAPIALVLLIAFLVYLRKKQRRTSGFLLCFTIFYPELFIENF